jgi:hypothetical protein
MYKSQIETILSLDAHTREAFRGCFAIDELSSLKSRGSTFQNSSRRRRRKPQERRGDGKDSSYVVNYDKSTEKGSHWIAIYHAERQPSSSSSLLSQSPLPEFFDSSGLPPLKEELQKYLLGYDFLYNPYMLQQIEGNACGFYSVYYILQRSRGKSADDILDFLTSLNNNSSGSCASSDFYVKDYIYKTFRPVFT